MLKCRLWSESWTEGEQKVVCFWRGDLHNIRNVNPAAKSESDLITVSVTGHFELWVSTFPISAPSPSARWSLREAVCGWVSHNVCKQRCYCNYSLTTRTPLNVSFRLVISVVFFFLPECLICFLRPCNSVASAVPASLEILIFFTYDCWCIHVKSFLFHSPKSQINLRGLYSLYTNIRHPLSLGC